MMLKEILKNSYQCNLPQDFNSFRKQAWSNCTLPHKKTELYRYYPLHQLYQQTFSSPTQDTVVDQKWIDQKLQEYNTNSFALFINGRFHSTKGQVTVLPVEKALKTYGQFLRQYWSRELKKEKDPFSLLNFTFQKDSAFIYVPPNESTETLLLLNIITEKNSLNFPRFHCFLSKGAQCQIVHSTQTPETIHALSSNYIALHLEENSTLNLYTETPNSPNLWGFETIRSQLKRDSTLNIYSLRTSAHVWRDDIHIQLMQKNSSASIQGSWLLKNKQHCHTNILMEHLEEQCQSKQHLNGVLNDFSRSNFSGKIYVHQNAQQTDAFQLNHNLLLSDKASASTLPNLEIFADDVKASHGATVGQLNEEELFYLCSRGLTQKQAQTSIIRGFVLDSIKEINIPWLKQRWETLICDYLA